MSEERICTCQRLLNIWNEVVDVVRAPYCQLHGKEVTHREGCPVREGDNYCECDVLAQTADESDAGAEVTLAGIDRRRKERAARRAQPWLREDFQRDLTHVLNKYSVDNALSSPDYLLAREVMAFLHAKRKAPRAPRPNVALAEELRAKSWPNAGHRGPCCEIGELMHRAANALDPDSLPPVSRDEQARSLGYKNAADADEQHQRASRRCVCGALCQTEVGLCLSCAVKRLNAMPDEAAPVWVNGHEPLPSGWDVVEKDDGTAYSVEGPWFSTKHEAREAFAALFKERKYELMTKCHVLGHVQPCKAAICAEIEREHQAVRSAETTRIRTAVETMLDANDMNWTMGEAMAGSEHVAYEKIADKVLRKVLEAIDGKALPIEAALPMPCPACEGDRAVVVGEGEQTDLQPCSRCNGTGNAPAIRGDTFAPGETMPCPACAAREELAARSSGVAGIDARKVRGAVAFVRDTWRNDGAEGESVHVICDAVEILMGGRCNVPPPGWWCSRDPGHAPPCAARPIVLPRSHDD